MLLVMFTASLGMLAGCASQGRLDHPKLETDSRRVAAAVNRSLDRVERAGLPDGEERRARGLLTDVEETQFAVDLVAAQLAGTRLSEAEAREAGASLSAVYRALEGVASRPPEALARGGEPLPPEAERMLLDLRRLVR